MKTSKLCLGTVQFGIPYGISNKNGQTSEANAANIMNYAYENGVTTLDTACSYGNSEEVIGKVIGENNWDIITKTPHFLSNRIDNEHLDNLVFSFKKSIDKIGRKSLYGLMIHSCDDLFKPKGEKLFQTMCRLKEEGLVKKIGVSVYSNEQLRALSENYPIDIVQLPMSIVDRRILESEHLSFLSNNNVEIYARSIFLQGLLLMSIEDIPSFFNPIRKNIERFHSTAKSLSLSSIELAMGFIYSMPLVDKVVVGVNTLKQLDEVISASNIEVHVDKFQDLSINNPDFINPSNWSV